MPVTTRRVLQLFLLAAALAALALAVPPCAAAVTRAARVMSRPT